jgi:hypothetical protein
MGIDYRILKEIFLCLVMIVFQQGIFAQKQEVYSLNEFFPLPGKDKPERNDVSSTVNVFASPDSIYFEIDVTDDKIVQNMNNEDRVEISFSLKEVNFNDYIIAEKDGKSFVFRNSNEAGDNADLEKFLKNGDYPEGKLRNKETGLSASSIVPSKKALKKEQLNFGISKFAFFPNGKKHLHLEREKYKAFEDQIGFKLDDLATSIKYTSTLNKNGYHLSIAMHNSSLGFANVAFTNYLKFAIDIIDVDEEAGKSEFISSSPNRFLGRTSYFNKVDIPFNFDISLSGLPSEVIEKLKVKIQVVRSNNTWKPFTYNNGPIIYAKEFMSESGLVEYVFFPQIITYSKGEKPNYEKVEIFYNDLSLFDQHEYYFVCNKKVLSSKGYRFNKNVPNDFVNSVFNLPDGTTGLILYDFEPADPMGWGEFGNIADEFIYVLQVNENLNKTIFNLGLQIEAAEKITIGEKNPLVFRNVKNLDFKWIEKGRKFSVLIKRTPSTFDEELKFEIQKDLQVVPFK